MSSQPHCFCLDGPAALTNSRSTRLAARLRSVDPSLTAVAARYRHFIQCDRPPGASEVARLSRLLEYGEPFVAPAWPAAVEALVVPRPGTVSPWSSKATDIARNCGFESVARIERGVLYVLHCGAGPASGARGPIEALHSPSGITSVLGLFFLLFTILPAFGGAVGAKLLDRD